MPASARRVDFADGYPVRLSAALHGGSGRLVTLSEGGAYVATPMALLRHAQLRLAIQIPEVERSVEVDAVVAWENRGQNRPSMQPEGYGMRFINIPRTTGVAIRWLLRRNKREHFPEHTAQSSSQAVSAAEVRAAMAHTEPQASRAQADIGGPIGEIMTQTLTGLEPEEERPPYPLNPASIERRVFPLTPGVFILSYDRTMDALVGRADTDLRATLLEFQDRYAFFHIEVVFPSKERFERECEMYHRMGSDRGQLENAFHPVPPPGPRLNCPVCVKL